MEWLTVPLPDDRKLDVLVGGDPDGLGLLFNHGTPGDATRYDGWFADAGARGLRAVAYSRPGYASSTRQAGRTVASATEDVTALLDYLGVGSFMTVGGSGGGPHAIACAARLADRCMPAPRW